MTDLASSAGSRRLPLPLDPERRRGWLVPALLILLSLVPVAAGAARLVQLAAGEAVEAHDARDFEAPLPAVLHIVSASVFCVLGALQVSAGQRRRRLRWHRRAGLVLTPAGVVAALSGLWMTVPYPPAEGDGQALAALRLVFGSAMFAALVAGAAALARGDFARHGAWMLRAYAIASGAGTQSLLLGPLYLLFGPIGGLPGAALMAAGWMINLGVAERVLRQRSTASGPALHTEGRGSRGARSGSELGAAP